MVEGYQGNDFSDLREFEEGNIDAHLQHIGDLILSYNTADGINFEATLGGGDAGADEESGDEEAAAGDDEEEEEDE
jgi:hypothetical protein